MPMPDPKEHLNSCEVRRYDLKITGDRLTVLDDASFEDATLYTGTVVNTPTVFLCRYRGRTQEGQTLVPAEKWTERVFLSVRSNEAWSVPPHVRPVAIGMVQYNVYDHEAALIALRNPAHKSEPRQRTLHVFELQSTRTPGASALTLYNRAELSEMIWSR